MSEPTRKTLSISRTNKAKPRTQSATTNKSSSTTKQTTSTTLTSTNSPTKLTGINLLEIKNDSLAFSLVGAAQAVAYVLEGVALPQALSRVFTQNEVAPSVRGAIQDIAYRTMRQVGRADALIKLMTDKPPEPALLYSLLCCALSLLLKNEETASETELAPYDDFVLVDQAVNAAASSPHMVFAKGMVNAVLRRFLREKNDLLPMVMKQASAKWNYPQWWIDQCKAAYPNQWQAILSVGNTPPPMTLRVNQRQISMVDYLSLLAQHSIGATQIGPVAVRLFKPMPVTQIPGFEQGLVSVQDAGAQLAANLLDVQDGMSVLDACAAPGGKTGHLLELAEL
ncbi:MAG: hypothetical protein K2P84_04485, partial [Undibacterium sp.]|nr:hypothetical protein [Undibacterium sp.]